MLRFTVVGLRLEGDGINITRGAEMKTDWVPLVATSIAGTGVFTAMFLFFGADKIFTWGGAWNAPQFIALFITGILLWEKRAKLTAAHWVGAVLGVVSCGLLDEDLPASLLHDVSAVLIIAWGACTIMSLPAHTRHDATE